MDDPRPHPENGPDRRTLATLALVAVLTLTPLARIWNAWGDYQAATMQAEAMRQTTVVPLRIDLLDRAVVELPADIRNLFTLDAAPSPPPPPAALQPSVPSAPPPAPLPAPPGPSLAEMVGNLRGALEDRLAAVRLPDPPPVDLGQIRLRGFYRRRGAQKALVAFAGKLLVVGVGDRIGEEIVVESCDFHRERLSLRLTRTGTVHQIEVER